MQSEKIDLGPAAIEKQQRWDWRYLRLLARQRHHSRWSKDPKAQVGAIIVNSTLGRIIAVGFTHGFPTNITDCALLSC